MKRKESPFISATTDPIMTEADLAFFAPLQKLSTRALEKLKLPLEQLLEGVENPEQRMGLLLALAFIRQVLAPLVARYGRPELMIRELRSWSYLHLLAYARDRRVTRAAQAAAMGRDPSWLNWLSTREAPSLADEGTGATPTRIQMMLLSFLRHHDNRSFTPAELYRHFRRELKGLDHSKLLGLLLICVEKGWLHEHEGTFRARENMRMKDAEGLPEREARLLRRLNLLPPLLMSHLFGHGSLGTADIKLTPEGWREVQARVKEAVTQIIAEVASRPVSEAEKSSEVWGGLFLALGPHSYMVPGQEAFLESFFQQKKGEEPPP